MKQQLLHTTNQYLHTGRKIVHFNILKMIKAEKSDKQTVTEILTTSFSNNRSVNYVIRQDHKKMDRIRKLMAYSFDTCFEFGDVYLSDCRRACALVLYPDLKRMSPASIWRDLKLAATVFGWSRTVKVLSREQVIKNTILRAICFISGSSVCKLDFSEMVLANNCWKNCCIKAS